jgi:FMNH2-dependent dimethyl sulfone monooxygenase
MYGVHFEQHDDRYARTAEWLEVLDRAWKEDHFSYEGKFYRVEDTVLQPKPKTKPRPVIYAGGESEAAKELIATRCDAYVMHGDPPERVRAKVEDMSARRERLGLPPMQFGVAAYTIVRDSEEEARKELERITDVHQSAAGYSNYQQWLAGTQLEQRVSLEDYSVSNRGLRSGLVGTPEQVSERVEEFEAAGVDLLLLQCSPQLEEMERFAAAVIKAESR